MLSVMMTCCLLVSLSGLFIFFFFFQAEDGIRDGRVTGVQTCALPILDFLRAGRHRRVPAENPSTSGPLRAGKYRRRWREIGRASCRERVEISGVAGSLKKKKE